MHVQMMSEMQLLEVHQKEMGEQQVRISKLFEFLNSNQFEA